ncbi:hypothetical protein GUITHDRAFT_101015 [Guillardia theta CCMP2712]|uniref:23S rRNA (Adenine(2030)-N(6))-methyltransferase RlmJ n=1 Tax=Guillardia theta (strain CCMP2712) TaxID=905079 RepID=L1JYP1_GUITC|nr:hypothetical protein GUITHDRAFT_101015 [Guillardia theta CCMP2712]EKX53310.1 hypothetical protein GUITHDRAFT_101015 [Guillardia theta CCMP2712]|eukprot:XP_005840290.1 hypothetical protein GUITHDRAFT_101015 [Guillardia theta CCMP2712]
MHMRFMRRVMPRLGGSNGQTPAARRSLNYRHAFHAGNFGDVMKHSILMTTIKHMQKKPNPMLLIDTHASTGLFDLRTPEATRSPEFKQGIHRVEEYYKKFGSSELPEDDRLVLSELHPQEIAALHSNFVDLNCNKKFPIKNPDFQATWERELKQLGINKMLLCKLLVRDPTIDRQRLNGCGILILNPPYQLDQDLSDYMPWLAKLLGETPQAMGSPAQLYLADS